MRKNIVYICDNCWKGGEELCIGGILGERKMYPCAVCGEKFSRDDTHAIYEDALPKQQTSNSVKAPKECSACGDLVSPDGLYSLRLVEFEDAGQYTQNRYSEFTPSLHLCEACRGDLEARLQKQWELFVASFTGIYKQ